MWKLKNIEIKKIIRLYQEGNSLRKTAGVFNITKGAVLYHLRKNKIPTRQSDGRRLYKIKHNYFNKINTQQKAYWLGFLLADGNHTKNTIQIGITDSEHLEKLRNLIYINKDKPIYIGRNNYNSIVYTLTIQHKQITQDLNRHGIVERKSKTAQFPQINKKYYPHLIRGIFDGDGCLTYCHIKTSRKYNFSIVGSEALMKRIQEIVKEEIGINLIYGKCKTIFVVQKGGNRQIITILKWLYKNANVCLERKYKKYIDMIEYHKTAKPIGFQNGHKLASLLSDKQVIKIKKMLKNGLRIIEISKKMKIKYYLVMDISSGKTYRNIRIK